jgi:hypothetical protein
MRIALLLSTCFAFSSWGQQVDFRAYTKQLCSPAFHGRGYVNQGDSIAAAYISQHFQKIGLSPIQGSYFQSFSFPVNTFPGKMLVYTESDTLRPGIDFLVAPNSGGMKGILNLIYFTPAKFLSISKSTFTLKKEEAIVIDYSGLPKDSLKLIKTKIAGLAASFPIIEITNEKLTWSVSQEASKTLHLIILKSAFKELPAKLYLDLEQKHIPNHVANNVIGYCAGKAKTKKTLLISAHYDHLGRMGSETYFPGGNDNASGNAMLIHLAEELIKHPIKYNVLFVAFAGEEIGLLGSKYMSTNPIIPLKDIRFMLNLDIMGSGEEGITVVNSTLFPKEFDLLKSINAKKRLLKEIKARGPAANSDHYYFTEAGVPAFFIYTMGPNKHYHDVEDRYEALSFEAFDSLNQLLLTFIRKIK